MKFNFICNLGMTRSGSKFAAIWMLVASVAFPKLTAFAQETYFVTYSHQMEEPGNLEVALKSVTGSPGGGNPFWGNALEFEYGVKAWWSSELYLDGQSTANESTVFTGFRWENRFRPLLGEHRINPVLYAEFEDINSADKSLLEVVGHDVRDEFLQRTDRHEKKREVELKLILSSNFRGWNLSENVIAEKNLQGEPWEFGYALATSRPLSLIASARSCVLCRENFSAGAELYGGLGDCYSFGVRDTSHYLAPVMEWRVPAGATFRVSPTFGLNQTSHSFLFRFGVAYEINQLASKLKGH